MEQRINILTDFLASLKETQGRNSKIDLLEAFKKEHPELLDDLIVIQECLDNKHPVGYTYPSSITAQGEHTDLAASTLRDLVHICEQPTKQKDLSQSNIAATIACTYKYSHLLCPVINRTLRLGIRLAEDVRNYKPMLACNSKDCFNGDIDYIIQEKLDGNRCIAHYDQEEQQWCFTSRSGKPLNVQFNMGQLNKDYIYDGEILTRSQTSLSARREKQEPFIIGENEFQALSGKVNSNKKEDKKDLVYNIYDIMIDAPCAVRQDIISWQRNYETGDFRFTHNLGSVRNNDMKRLLDYVISTGGEGLILRDPQASYVHGRTSALLKVKKMQTMDMECYDTEKGTGKNADRIGKLRCRITQDDGTYVEANVGSGLTDTDRDQDPSYFVGKIVEVQYFEKTEAQGREGLSLRFPVYLSIREDKDTTSEY